MIAESNLQESAMSVWDTYPDHYRSQEILMILKAVQAGECVSLVGLSGAGKSNLLGFMAHRVMQGPRFCLVDCNDLPAANAASLFSAMIESMGEDPLIQADARLIIRVVEKHLRESSTGICFLFDRFDLFNGTSPEQISLTSNLRALRDHFKYTLTYITATRTPLQSSSELAELFSGNICWLGSLSREDALWSISQFAARHGETWDIVQMEKIYAITLGYPSMLRAVCEAYLTGVPLDVDALRSTPAVLRRVEEFWADTPRKDYLQNVGLQNHPLLSAVRPILPDAAELTAAEQRLLEYFTAHADQVCEKGTLIQAVWPDEKIAAGLRDDSLTQLVHRLREKVDLGGRKHIETIPGRGYRYRQ